MTATTETARALAGLRVLELADGWSAGTLCGRLLADLGATVRKLEPPGGDPIRRFGPPGPGGIAYAAASLLHGKRPVPAEALRAGAEGILDLARDADVMIIDQSWLARLTADGLASPSRWRQASPRLVVAAITPFGGQGSSAGRAGTELTVQACAGITMTTGHPGGPPTRSGVAMGAHATALIACGAVLAAVYRRAWPETGAWLDVSEFDAMVMMLGNVLPGYFATGNPPSRTGNVQPLSAPWNCYPAADGQVVIVAISESLWRRLLHAIGRDEVADDPAFADKSRRVARRDEVDRLIAGWTSARTCAQITQLLLAARIPVARVNSVAEALADDFLTERAMLVTAEIDGTAMPAVGSIFKLTDTAPAASSPDASSPTTSSPVGGDRREPADAGGGPLSGVRVLELGGHTAAGMCTRLLADLGATVIKVELPHGDDARYTVPVLADGSAYLWHSWNVGKRSVVLDLASDGGYGVMARLLARSDVFVHNLGPDTLRRLRLSPPDVAAVNDRLVHCSVSGFGVTGSQRDRRAFDAILQAEAGIMSVTGGVSDPPVKTGPSVVDNLSAMAAVATILAGLHRRRRTGRGVLADLALYDVAAWLTAEWWPAVWSGLGATARGDRHPYVSLENSYPSADGGRVAVSCRTPDQAGRAARLFGLGADPASWDGQVAMWVAARTADEAADLCQRAGVPAERHRDIPAVVSHPLLAERDMLPSIPVADGTDCRVIGSPYQFLGEPPARAMPRHAPALGEHSAPVLAEELGYSEAEIDMLRRSGAVVTGSAGHAATAAAGTHRPR